MNPFRLSLPRPSEGQKQMQRNSQKPTSPKDRLILVQEVIQKLLDGSETVIGFTTFKNIPQDLRLDDIMTTVHLDDGTILATEWLSRFSRPMAIVTYLYNKSP